MTYNGPDHGKQQQQEMMCVCVLQRGNSGDGCDMTSTLYKGDLRKGHLFVLSCDK